MNHFIVIHCQLCDADIFSLLDYENHMREYEHDEREIEE